MNHTAAGTSFTHSYEAAGMQPESAEFADAGNDHGVSRKHFALTRIVVAYKVVLKSTFS